MKRLLFASALALFLSPSVFALQYFEISPFATTQTAGATRAVTAIMAKNGGGAVDTDFNGTATLTASSGPGTFSPSTLTFVNGTAMSSPITLKAAGAVDLTLTSGLVSNVAGWTQVNPGSLNHLIVLRHSREIQENLTPGVFPGWNYQGVTLTTGYPVAVSIVAVDSYYNRIYNGYGGTFVLSAGTYDSVTPYVRYTNDGLAGFTWTPNPPAEGRIFFSLNIYGEYLGLESSLTNRDNLVKIQDTFHLWIDGPTWSVIAGTPFLVTVTASNSAQDRVPTGGASNYQFDLAPVMGDGSAAHGTLTPTQARLSTNGQTCNAYAYTKAELFKIKPTITSPLNPKNIVVEYSQLIDVKPSLPAQLSASPSPAAIQARHTSVIRAVLVDAYQNPVPNVPVSFEKTAGSDDATVSPAQANTNAAGIAESILTGGIINETATVRVKVNNLVQDISIDISVASIEGDSMVNYPNPFNPADNEKTLINYFLKGESDIEIRIYDAFGRMVFSRDLKPGEGTGDFAYANRAGGACFQWNGRNGENKVVANGIYLVKVTAHNMMEVQKFSRRVGVLK